MANEIRKVATFNPETEKNLVEHLEGRKFSTYVKQLIRKDMEGKQETTADDVLRYILSNGITVNNDLVTVKNEVVTTNDEEIKEEEIEIPDYAGKGFSFGGFKG